MLAKYSSDIRWCLPGSREEIDDCCHYDEDDPISSGDEIELPERNEEKECDDYQVFVVERLDEESPTLVHVSFSHWRSEE